MPRKKTGGKTSTSKTEDTSGTDPVAEAYAAGKEAGRAIARHGLTVRGRCPYKGPSNVATRKAWLAGVNESLPF